MHYLPGVLLTICLHYLNLQSNLIKELWVVPTSETRHLRIKGANNMLPPTELVGGRVGSSRALVSGLRAEL